MKENVVRPYGQRCGSQVDKKTLKTHKTVNTSYVNNSHNNFGDRSFGAAGPRVWNSLPPHLRRDMNFARFKRQLKTFLFGS